MNILAYYQLVYRMKFFPQLFFVLIAVMILPQGQGGSVPVRKMPVNSIHVASVPSSTATAEIVRVKTTVTRHKRRPVALNDGYGHDKVCTVSLGAITVYFHYVDKILSGYYYNPYLSVPIPLRSWRGPPTA